MKLNAYYSITNGLRSEAQECLSAIESLLINNPTSDQENLIDEIKQWSIKLAKTEAASAVLQKYFGDMADNAEQKLPAENISQ